MRGIDGGVRPSTFDGGNYDMAANSADAEGKEELTSSINKT